MTPGGIYKGMLRLYPHAHRREYGDDMVQVFGDRWRDERPASSPLQFLTFWVGIVGDVVRTALTERTERTMNSLKEKWWLWLAAIAGAIQVVIALGVGLSSKEDTAQRIASLTIIGGLAVAALVGVWLVSGGNRRGGYLIAIGVLPAAAVGIVFFWFPPMWLATIAGIAVVTKAIQTASGRVTIETP